MGHKENLSCCLAHPVSGLSGDLQVSEEEYHVKVMVIMMQMSLTWKHSDRQTLPHPWHCGHFLGTSRPCPPQPREHQSNKYYTFNVFLWTERVLFVLIFYNLHSKDANL